MSFLTHPWICAFFLGVACLASARPDTQAAVALPPAPEGMILDQSRVLLPERAEELSMRLTALRGERSIWIYVVTVPSLGVAPSVQRERLSNLGHFYADGWLADRLGVVFLIDDESQAAIIVASTEADRQFPPLQRNLLMQDPLREVQREKFLRDKVEGTTLVIVDVLSGLQDEAKRAARRDRVVNTLMAVTAVIGIAVLLLVKWKTPNRSGSLLAERKDDV